MSKLYYFEMSDYIARQINHYQNISSNLHLKNALLIPILTILSMISLGQIFPYSDLSSGFKNLILLVNIGSIMFFLFMLAILIRNNNHFHKRGRDAMKILREYYDKNEFDKPNLEESINRVLGIPPGSPGIFTVM